MDSKEKSPKQLIRQGLVLFDQAFDASDSSNQFRTMLIHLGQSYLQAADLILRIEKESDK